MRKLVADGKLNRAYQAEWAQRLINLLRPVYGKRNPLLITMEQWRKEIIGGGITTEAFIAKLERSEHFLRPLNGPGEAGSLVVASQASLAPTTDKIFLIHGHDEMNQLRLSRLINDEFHLEPVVLLDKPGKSAPTIDKFEDHAQSCSYAIALFTADDKVVTKRGEEYWQPRPNVIFETGWFVGRLGKERVLILLQDGVRIYSDFDGVNRVQFQENVDDKFRAIRGELNAAGLVNRT
ncbi:MAG: nucleotide-binding protein [Blastocatellia bacterium]|nr:nucleotide-binding protein [Blastocatellia bacterium]